VSRADAAIDAVYLAHFKLNKLVKSDTMLRMKQRIYTFVALCALLFTFSTLSEAQLSNGQAPRVTASALITPVTYAKTCSNGYTDATIGGKHKCLRAGQFCAKRYQKQYKKYGYKCVNGRLKRR